MTHTIQRDGTSIDCLSFGSGTRPLVMLPGLSLQRVRGAALSLRLMYREFTRTHRVYVIDKKDTVPDGYTIRDIAGDTAHVMEELGLSGACLTCDSYPELHKISCPALVLGGGEDRVLTGGASRELAKALGCGLHMYEGLGHAAYDEAGDFNQRILRFFTQ